jgi:DNA repair protein RadD
MTLEKLISRADEQTLQELLGRDALCLIQLLNRNDEIATRVRNILIQLYTLEGLLLIKEKRSLLFDLLRQKELEVLCKVLSVEFDENSYERLKRMNFRRGADKEKALFEYFELKVPEVEEKIEEPQTEIIPGEYTLFKHQRVAARNIIKKLAIQPRRVLLHMPTGSGKTRTAMHVIASHLIDKEQSIVIWLAYSEELCEQAVGEFKKAWASLGNRDVEIHRFWGKYDLDLNNIKDGVLIAGLSKMYSAIRKKISISSNLASKCSLVIVDEAHQAIAETYRLVLDALFHYNHDTGLLGLTATPGRTTLDMTQDAELSDFFSRNKVTLEVEGYHSPIDYLVKEQYLAKTEYRTIDYEGQDDFREFNIEEKFEIPAEVLTRLAKDDLRNLKILSSIESLTKKHKRILVFAINVKHAEVLAAVLRGRGLVASSIVADTPREERKRIIEDFKNKSPEVKILCNYGVLTTGFDAPQTSAAIITRPTKSLVLFSQMVGRVTRGVKAQGNKKAEVVTVVDMSLPGFKNMVEAFNNWEDVWQ